MQARLLLFMALIALCACGERGDDGITALSNSVSLLQPPDPPVIWLHYDYMVQKESDAFTGPHSDAPHRESIQRVIDSFRRHGIQLMIDPEHEELPHATWLGFDYDGAGCASFLAGQNGRSAASFQALKAEYFRPHGNRAWHYVIFGHGGAAMSPMCLGVTGFADLPGYDFMVTVGSALYDTTFSHMFCDREFTQACLALESGAIMHELGHNLDLRHGGDDDDLYKPNYLSVMNYQWFTGVYFASAPGSVSPPFEWRTDYSDLELPPLDENHLDERVGLNGPSWSTAVGLFECWACSYVRNTPFFVLVLPTAPAPVDWNGNGVIESDVAMDVNFLETMLQGGYVPDIPESRRVLRGFDDWSHVRQFLRLPAYAAAELRPTRSLP